MASRFGNANTSALLRAAESARERTAAYNEQYEAFLYESSAKTTEDFKRYSGFLKGRAGDVESSDPSKYLTIQSKLRSSQRSHFSEEIQRETIKIQEGRGNEYQKLEKLRGLLGKAEQLQDANLYQNLWQQYNAQAIKVQNQEIAAANAAGAARGAGLASNAKSIKSMLSKIEEREKIARIELAQGVITATEFGDLMTQLLVKGGNEEGKSKAELLTRALEGKEGELSDSEYEKFTKDLNDLYAGDEYNKFASRAISNLNGAPTDAVKFNRYGVGKLEDIPMSRLQIEDENGDGKVDPIEARFNQGVDGDSFWTSRKLGENSGYAGFLKFGDENSGKYWDTKTKKMIHYKKMKSADGKKDIYVKALPDFEDPNINPLDLLGKDYTGLGNVAKESAKAIAENAKDKLSRGFSAINKLPGFNQTAVGAGSSLLSMLSRSESASQKRAQEAEMAKAAEAARVASVKRLQAIASVQKKQIAKTPYTARPLPISTRYAAALPKPNIKPNSTQIAKGFASIGIAPAGVTAKSFTGGNPAPKPTPQKQKQWWNPLSW